MSNPHTIEGEWTDDTPNLPTTVAQPRGVTIIQAPQAKDVNLSTPADLERAVTQASNLMEFKDRIVKLTVRNANPKSIVDQDGVPYFTEKECERMLAVMGGARITITQPPAREDDEDGHFGFSATVTVHHPAFGSFDGFGSAHSTDQFLGTNNDAWKDRDDGYGRRLEKVSRHNLAQHALTRAKGAAIRNMLGLNAYTWEELEEMGFKKGAGGSVERKGRRSSGSGSRPRSGGGGGRAGGVKGAMLDAMKGADLSFNNLSNFAKAMGWYDGEKILDAPPEVMEQITAAILESPDDVRAA